MNLRYIDWTGLFMQGFLWLTGAIGVSIAGLMIYIAAVEEPRDRAHEAALRTECLADGHKEYQCEAMLRRPAGAGAVPILIPMPLGR